MRPVDEAKPINTRRRTSSTELHWIPRTDNGRTTAGLHEWAVVDRELGADGAQYVIHLWVSTLCPEHHKTRIAAAGGDPR